MTNLTETPNYEAGIYQLETTDPVVGGPNGIDNLQAKQLANRTAFLKAQLDAIEHELNALPDVYSRTDSDSRYAQQGAQGLDNLNLANHEKVTVDSLGSVVFPKKLSVAEGIFYTAVGGIKTHLGFWSQIINRGTGAEWSSGYLHLKTNLTGMFRIDVTGYDYGSSRAIDSTYAGYVYNGNIVNANHYDNNTENNNQVAVNKAYLANDGSLVVVVYSASWYVTHLILNSMCQSTESAVTATSMRSSNANHY